MNTNQVGQSCGVQAIAATLALGFKFLAWINGIGVVAILAFGVGIVPIDLAPPWLRVPLAAFLGGLVLAALGLLWSYSVQASLFNQSLAGRRRRTHWIPMFFTILAYSFSLLAFVCGCWFTLNLASMVYLSSEDVPSSNYHGGVPFDQFKDGDDFISNPPTRRVMFAGS
ncbi:hypothetical protein EKL30_15620 [Candidimonas sp. SYP-B2681]|uniref:hypothetical protein n=1 Tax=Candidimonas sp. SYP-B2681 TaxID=2497686 RepID=UPI000F88FD25|nr:hypothetical protein [Candidimonas sp. SYP-B2681]RTZ41110.1 hypothetical protein EKL30_15620 [Candidimonas sp. SYP-B2681]